MNTGIRVGLWNDEWLNPTHCQTVSMCGDFLSLIGLTGNEANKLGKVKPTRLEWFNSWRGAVPLLQVDMQHRQIIEQDMAVLRQSFDILEICEPWFISSEQIAKSGIPVVAFTYENIPHVHNSESDRIAILEVAKRCRKWIVPTKMSAFCWGEVHGDAGFKQKIEIVPRAINCDQFKPLPEGEKKKNERVRILLNGRITWSKGHEDMIFAAKALSRKRDDFEICFIGREEGAGDRLKQLVKAMGLERVVSFLPGRDYHEMPGLYHEFDIVCVLSIPVQGWHEQWCMSILEGMASGLPVMVAMSDGAMAQIDDDRLIVPPNRHDILAEKLEMLINDEKQRESIGWKMRQRAERKFNAATRAVELRKLYESCL